MTNWRKGNVTWNENLVRKVPLSEWLDQYDYSMERRYLFILENSNSPPIYPNIRLKEPLSPTTEKDYSNIDKYIAISIDIQENRFRLPIAHLENVFLNLTYRISPSKASDVVTKFQDFCSDLQMKVEEITAKWTQTGIEASESFRQSVLIELTDNFPVEISSTGIELELQHSHGELEEVPALLDVNKDLNDGLKKIEKEPSLPETPKYPLNKRKKNILTYILLFFLILCLGVITFQKNGLDVLKDELYVLGNEKTMVDSILLYARRNVSKSSNTIDSLNLVISSQENELKSLQDSSTIVLEQIAVDYPLIIKTLEYQVVRRLSNKVRLKFILTYQQIPSSVSNDIPITIQFYSLPERKAYVTENIVINPTSEIELASLKNVNLSFITKNLFDKGDYEVCISFKNDCLKRIRSFRIY